MVEKSESPRGLFGDAVKAAAHRTRTGQSPDAPVTGISHGHEDDPQAPQWPMHLLAEGKDLAAGEAPPAFG